VLNAIHQNHPLAIYGLLDINMVIHPIRAHLGGGLGLGLLLIRLHERFDGCIVCELIHKGLPE
jgi:hypothetical protein